MEVVKSGSNLHSQSTLKHLCPHTCVAVSISLYFVSLSPSSYPRSLSCSLALLRPYLGKSAERGAEESKSIGLGSAQAHGGRNERSPENDNDDDGVDVHRGLVSRGTPDRFCAPGLSEYP